MKRKMVTRLNDSMDSIIDRDTGEKRIVLTVNLRDNRSVVKMLLDAGKTRDVDNLVNNILENYANRIDKTVG